MRLTKRIDCIRNDLLLSNETALSTMNYNTSLLYACALLCITCFHTGQTPLMLSGDLIPRQLLNIRLGPVITY